MKKFYFTFGINNELRHFVQPILAKTMEEAETIMFDNYGSDWAFGYPDKPDNKQDLPVLRHHAGPTQTEIMNVLTERLSDIKRVTRPFRAERLIILMSDLEGVFDLNSDVEAKRFYIEVGEELSESIKVVS